MKKHLDYKILGETRDDAAGEAFDKVAKMLGLGYPGGPLISKLAEKGNPKAINFPRPMINSGDFNFSFSGLKTSVLYYLRERFPENRPEAQALQDLAQRDGASRAIFQQKNMRVLAKSGAKAAESASEISGTESSLANIAASFEQAVVDVLVKKTANALRHYGVGRTAIKSLVVGGGVAANKALRSALSNRIAKSFPAVSLHISPLWLCGDNAAMIAVAAYFKAIKKNFAKPDSIKAEGGLKLK